MINRCSRCGMCIERDNEVMVDGKYYHTYCSKHTIAELEYPEGHKSFKELEKLITDLNNCDPKDLYSKGFGLKLLTSTIKAFLYPDAESELDETVRLIQSSPDLEYVRDDMTFNRTKAVNCKQWYWTYDGSCMRPMTGVMILKCEEECLLIGDMIPYPAVPE